jgi:hypothetical protein
VVCQCLEHPGISVFADTPTDAMKEMEFAIDGLELEPIETRLTY